MRLPVPKFRTLYPSKILITTTLFQISCLIYVVCQGPLESRRSTPPFRSALSSSGLEPSRTAVTDFYIITSYITLAQIAPPLVTRQWASFRRECWPFVANRIFVLSSKKHLGINLLRTSLIACEFACMEALKMYCVMREPCHASGIGATVWCIEGYHYCYNN